MTIEDELQEIIRTAHEEDMRRIAAGLRLADAIEVMMAEANFDIQKRGVLVEHFGNDNHGVSLSADVPWGTVRFVHRGDE